MTTDLCTISALRSTLNHLYEPRALRTSPLARMLTPSGRRSTPTATRQALIKAIESLKPSGDVHLQSAAWRTYEILHYRYVQQCSQDEVAHQLGLSVRHLKREQRRALEVLAEYLREHHKVQFSVGDEPEDTSDAEQPTEATVVAREELQWLEELPPSKSTEIREVLPTVLNLARPMATRYGTELQTHYGEEVPPLAVRAVALRQMLLSVLSVAIRRVAGGVLTVSVRHAGRDVEIELRGRPSQQQPALTSEDKANLAVARQMVRTCGGRLELPESTDGFSVALRLSAAGQLQVLVIDDNPDAVRLLQRFVTGTRYLVSGAQDPEQAFALACERKPQIIVLDVMMPEVDGWEVLGRLMQHPVTSSIPVIACTVLAQEELARSLGVSAFLRKPVTRQSLLAALDRVLPLAAS